MNPVCHIVGRRRTAESAFTSTLKPRAIHWSCLLLLLLASLVGVVAGQTADERPLLHPLFADHAVLQRDMRVPVWGWTEPRAKVTVTFAGQTRTATAGASGQWQVRLKAMPASAEPRTMTVTSTAGDASVTIHDLLVGDVWLCSGQSNMEMGIGNCNAPNDIATADFPLIRLMTVPRLVASEPVETTQCRWLPCSPETVMQGVWGGFSAAGFYFGRDLYRELGIPIGLIHSSWGGTVAEAWTSEEGLEPLPEFAEPIERLHASANRKDGNDFAKIFGEWAEQKDPGTQEGWEKPGESGAEWESVEMPRPFEQAGLPGYDGMVWFRREFDLPDSWAGRALELELGPIDDIDTTWVNGARVGQMNRYDLVRSYSVPAGVLKSGRNVIVVRVLDTGGGGGFTGQPSQMRLRRTDAGQTPPISLAGTWRMRASAPMSQLGRPPTVTDPSNPNVPTVLYNGMIAPLLPFAIKGAIWYQGESNAGRAAQYRRLLPAMIKDWRKRFGVGDFPFYIVQLAAFQATFPEPRDNAWAELREAQALTAKTLRHCGLAVAIDIGNATDIHPKDKYDVGHRLALNALAQTYDRKIEWSGPWYRSMRVRGDTVRLRFDHADGGLVARGDKLTGFAIAGEDRKFVWADARIEGDAVLVSSPDVPHPVAVRYAWDANPVCNLFNEAGLPAVPFRTDDWPMITEQAK